MDSNAWALERNHGIKVDYSRPLGGITEGGLTVRFFELVPRQLDHVWLEAMPVDSCLRCNVENSGRCLRSKMQVVLNQVRALADGTSNQ